MKKIKKILIILILGIGLSGAILMILIPQIFEDPNKYILKNTSFAITITFLILSISALILRKKFNKKL